MYPANAPFRNQNPEKETARMRRVANVGRAEPCGHRSRYQPDEEHKDGILINEAAGFRD
jgi:hypothetical protein